MNLITRPNTSLLDQFDRILSSFTLPQQSSVKTSETDDAYSLKLDLPGVAREDISTTLENRVLTLNVTPGEEDAFVNTFSHNWKLPNDVDTDAIGATLENGVLMLNLPKSKKATEIKTIAIS